MNQPTVDEKERLISLVDELVACGFKAALSKVTGTKKYQYYDVSGWIERHHNFLNAFECQVEYGATRVVVIPEFSNWVLKFTYIEKYQLDYNAIELKKFQLACDKELDKYFAAIYYLGSLYGMDVYIQEKVKIDEELTSDSFINYTIDNYYSDVDCEDEETYDQVCCDSYELDNEERIGAMLGAYDANELIDFCSYYDINDLHSGNWGYRDNEPVLVDYAGF